MIIRRITVDTPVGAFTLSASEHGLRRVSFPDEAPNQAADTGTERDVDRVDADTGTEPSIAGVDAVLAEAARQFCEYFDGRRREFDIPLDLEGTDFQLEAWHSLAKVPYGETSGYGRHAASLDRPGAARAVGAAAAKNPVPIVLPCHRLVASDGSLTGFAGGLDMKQRLLAHEQAHTEPEGRPALAV